ncbi:ABC transporter I family member 6, chloroplastic-like isoform X2 [Physcomitrium patens]|uniref:ABC transporter domain-containing protein n=2 Tax=Physcomitrium patens TaxID=3218 RepID=A0A7I4D314_PHYPA|nr:ABC transporter I family member 6, chloroplastic-like isoform X2 [Physcomitrium patens]|eukprot:XP_024403756.1 ABC transporter I family member 6, chloroplastic-like isoform X2 [Physcomitrella patens]
MASCSSYCQHVSSSAGVRGLATSRCNVVHVGAGRVGIQMAAGILHLREKSMTVCGEKLEILNPHCHRKWRRGSCGGAVALSANALAAQFDEVVAEKSDSPVILEVQGLTAVVSDTRQEILKGVDLVIRAGEVHAIMGKNGSGKSTLSKVLVGHPDYEVTGGTAIFKGENLRDKEPEERSHCGLFLSFQSPVEIPGVSNMDFLRMACNARRKAQNLEELGPLEFYGFVAEKLGALNMDPKFLDRNVNEGFSGGEKKRNEIL